MVIASMSSKRENPLQILSRKASGASPSFNPSRVFHNSKGKAAATTEGRRPPTKHSVQGMCPGMRLLCAERGRNDENPSKRGRRSSESDAQLQPRQSLDAVPRQNMDVVPFVADARYANPKYREPPEPAVLPLPPVDWVQSCGGDHGVGNISRDIKNILRVSVPVHA